MNFNPGWKFICNVPPSGQHGLLYNYFFQHHSELNTPMISTNIFFRKHDGIKIFNDQASSSEAVARKCSVKKCSQTFRKTVSRKSVSDLDTGPFLSILQNFKNTFVTEHLRWLLFPILKSLDSQRQWCKWISELLTILLISAFLVLVGIFAFIFGKHKLSVASRRLL